MKEHIAGSAGEHLHLRPAVCEDEEFRKKECAQGIRPAHILFSGDFMQSWRDTGVLSVLFEAHQDQILFAVVIGHDVNIVRQRQACLIQQLQCKGTGGGHGRAAQDELIT